MSFAIWLDDLMRIAYSWNLGEREVESVPLDYYESCRRRNWNPGDALMAAMQDVGLMNENGYF